MSSWYNICRILSLRSDVLIGNIYLSGVTFVCFSVHREPKIINLFPCSLVYNTYCICWKIYTLDHFFNSVKTQTPYEIIVLHVINILTKRRMPHYDFRPLTFSKLKREYPMGRQHVTGNVNRWPDTSLLIEVHLTDCMMLRNSLHFVTYLNCLKRQEQKFDSCNIKK